MGRKDVRTWKDHRAPKIKGELVALAYLWDEVVKLRDSEAKLCGSDAGLLMPLLSDIYWQALGKDMKILSGWRRFFEYKKIPYAVTMYYSGGKKEKSKQRFRLWKERLVADGAKYG